MASGSGLAHVHVHVRTAVRLTPCTPCTAYASAQYSTLVASGATTFCTATSSTSKTSLSVSAVANVLSLSYFKSCACPTQNGVLDVTCANGGVVPAQYLWQLNMWAAYNRGCPSNQFVLGAVANSICEAVSSAMGATSAPKPDAHAPLPPPLTATLLGGHGGDASTAGGAPGGSELTDVVSLYFWSQICKRSAQTCYSSTKLTPECGKLVSGLRLLLFARFRPARGVRVPALNAHCGCN